MTAAVMTSKQRVLAAVRRQPTDRAPIMIYVTPEIDAVLRQHFGDVDYHTAFGVDFRTVGPQALRPNRQPGPASNIARYDESFVIVIARAYAWQELLGSGKYRSIREMAKSLGVCATYMSRLLRFTILAPDIIEAILDGQEPDGFSQTKLTGAIPADWEEQRRK